jgi:hypothetical protein
MHGIASTAKSASFIEDNYGPLQDWPAITIRCRADQLFIAPSAAGQAAGRGI